MIRAKVPVESHISGKCVVFIWKVDKPTSRLSRAFGTELATLRVVFESQLYTKDAPCAEHVIAVREQPALHKGCTMRRTRDCGARGRPTHSRDQVVLDTQRSDGRGGHQLEAVEFVHELVPRRVLGWRQIQIKNKYVC